MGENKTKVVKMNTQEAERPEKMSYEQLENVAHQLSEQAKHLYAQLQESNMNNMFKRLDYLFKVIENSYAFSTEFIEACVKEIEDMMIVPEEDTEDSKPEE